MNKLIGLVLAVQVVLVLQGCVEEAPQEASFVRSKKESQKEMMVQRNQYIVEDEQYEINELIKRYDWEMTNSGTGLRYMIYKQGNGRRAKVGDDVKVKIEVRLINGQKVDIDNDLLSFTLHRSENINGLEEGILKMKEGDKAKLIIPSYLGYGLLGRDEKVPMRSTLVFDVELINVAGR